MPPLTLPPPADLARAPTDLAASAALPTLAANPAAVYLAGLTTRARRTQRSALDQIAKQLGATDALACPWPQLRYAHTTVLRAWLQDTYAPATANRMLAALRRVLEESWRLGLLDRETYERAADLKPINGETVLAGRALEEDELRALLTACATDSTPAGVRDAALIALLYAAGLRRSEASGIDVADYTPATGALTIRGKGKKTRIVYVGDAAELLGEYLVLRGREGGPLFVRARKGGRLAPTRLSDQGVRDILARRAKEAGVTDVRPHDLRRTFISDLLDAGADIASAQRLAGHADPKTTSRYDRRGERAKQRAARLLKLPRRTLPLDGD
jgi:site-specific recombinase XerD